MTSSTVKGSLSKVADVFASVVTIARAQISEAFGSARLTVFTRMAASSVAPPSQGGLRVESATRRPLLPRRARRHGRGQELQPTCPV